MRYILLLVLLPGSALGGSVSIGPLGIDAVGLRGPNNEILDGMDVKIGQVETLRPADPDVDTGIFPNNSINPAQVTLQQSVPPANNFGETGPTDFPIRSHPTEVAGVMISTDTTAKGVATAAMLYADAYVVEAANEVQALKSIQHVINAGGHNEGRAINNSWDKEFPGGDGFSPLTLGVDWMATRYNSLIVVAVNESARPDHDSPADNFNGITVSASQRIGGTGAYRQAWGDSDVDVTSESVHYEIDLLAPGVGV